MLQVQTILKSLSKLEKLLLVALLVLGGLFIKREVNRPVEKSAIVRLVPTEIKKIDNKEHAQVREIVYTEKQFKDSTKADKRLLKAHKINSVTTIVDQFDTSYKNASGLSMPNDTISIKRYETKKWLFAPVVHRIDITHSDTSIHSIAASSISYKEPKVLFTIGPYLGYDIFQKKPSFGVCITMNLFSIKSRR